MNFMLGVLLGVVTTAIAMAFGFVLGVYADFKTDRPKETK